MSYNLDFIWVPTEPALADYDQPTIIIFVIFVYSLFWKEKMVGLQTATRLRYMYMYNDNFYITVE